MLWTVIQKKVKYKCINNVIKKWQIKWTETTDCYTKKRIISIKSTNRSENRDRINVILTCEKEHHDPSSRGQAWETYNVKCKKVSECIVWRKEVVDMLWIEESVVSCKMELYMI